MSTTLETEGAFTVAGGVDYAQGAIVSKTIIKNPAGTVTLFAFDKGEGLSGHSAPYQAMAFIIDGQAGITIADTAYQVSAGQAIILPANIQHAVHATERCKMMLVMIKG